VIQRGGRALPEQVGIDARLGQKHGPRIAGQEAQPNGTGEHVGVGQGLHQNGGPGHPGQAQGGQSESAVNEPRIERDIEQRSRGQHIAEGFGFPEGHQAGIDAVAAQEKYRAEKYHADVGQRRGQVVPFRAHPTKQRFRANQAQSRDQHRGQQPEGNGLGGQQPRLLALPRTQRIGHQRSSAGTQAGPGGQDEEKDRKRNGEPGHRLGGYPACEKRVGQIKQRVAEHADTRGQGDAAQQGTDRAVGEVGGEHAGDR
jgi:hypothetical protein